MAADTTGRPTSVPRDDDVHDPDPDIRQQLAATVVSAAGPYGYTISLGGSTALASGHLGPPAFGEVLLLMLGSVIGFLLLEIASRGAHPDEPARSDRPPSIWGNAHIPAAGSALTLVWLLVDTVHGSLVWMAVGFLATVIYFLGTVLQRVAVRRMTSPPLAPVAAPQRDAGDHKDGSSSR